MSLYFNNNTAFRMHTYWLNIRVVVDIVSFAQIGRYLFIYSTYIRMLLQQWQQFSSNNPFLFITFPFGLLFLKTLFLIIIENVKNIKNIFFVGKIFNSLGFLTRNFPLFLNYNLYLTTKKLNFENSNFFYTLFYYLTILLVIIDYDFF